MNAIFVDFEMNPITRAHEKARHICAGEIIEIGAVKINEDGKEIASYKQYVLPEYETQMNQTCQDLTGITMETLAGAPRFQEAFPAFLSWCNESNGNDYEIYAWSENDKHQLTGEMRLKDMDMTGTDVCWMLDHWKNFQQIYCDLIGLDTVISLNKAVDILGEAFDGKMHDALWDARNTSKLYVATKKRKDLLAVIRSIIASTKQPEPLTFSLADAFMAARK